MIQASELLEEITRLVMETGRGTEEETAHAFNDRLASVGFEPNGVAAMGHSLSTSWQMQHNVSPQEAIAGAFTTGLLVAAELFKAGKVSS